MKIILKVFTITLFSLTGHQSFSQCLEAAEAFKEFYKNNIATLASIEGIWSVTKTTKIYDQGDHLVDTKYESQASEWAIIRDGEHFKACNISYNNYESSIRFSKTAATDIYLYQERFFASYAIAKANAKLTPVGLLEYSYEVPNEELQYKLRDKYVNGMSIIVDIKMIKIFPSREDIQITKRASATGFGITSNGLIVTNSHVINGSSKIIVRGINGDFSKMLSAKLLIEDKINDLAIIQINDPEFVTLGLIPFTIAVRSADVGSSVYALGYPLKSIMGEEIKLTNGIISSKTGFQGDVTSYQTSVPLQPGNSGGPLFDTNGNLVGVVNAKLTIGENVSYAIKSVYLTNLLDLLPTSPQVQTINSLTGKQFSAQVKTLSRFVYIIEVN